MSKIRSIKPQMIEDEKVGPLSDTAFRLFASMIVLSDDHGNVRADVRWLTAQVWWAHNSPPNVLSALVELSKSGLIYVYGVRGGTYAHLNGWQKHQRIDNAAKGRVPTQNDEDAQQVDPEFGYVAEKRGEPPRVSANIGSDRSGLDRSGGEGIGVELECAEKISADHQPPKPKRRGRPKRAETPMPSDWEPREQELALASQLGLNPPREALRFRDHNQAKGTLYADWHAAFRMWLNKGAEFAAQRRQSTQTGLDAVLAIANGEGT
jgi:hypothetical protein